MMPEQRDYFDYSFFFLI
ncbi:hypothetical protein [Shewanella litorisediminis]